MSKNIKILNEEELKELESKYIFEINNDLIVVSSTTMNRRVVHNKNEDFALNTKVKNLTISKEAIDYWQQINSDNYSLFRIQNVLNILECTYQKKDLESVRNFLNNNKNREK